MSVGLTYSHCLTNVRFDLTFRGPENYGTRPQDTQDSFVPEPLETPAL